MLNRPLCIMTLMALSGMLCGLWKTDLVFRLAAVIAAAVLLQQFLKLQFFRNKQRYAAVFTVSCLCFFLLGFFRSFSVSYSYERPNSAAYSFFQQYVPRNPGEFDYALYLKANGIDSSEKREAMLARSSASSLSEETENRPLFLRLRDVCAGILSETLSETDAGIYRALLLGDKKSLAPEIKALFQAAGISHILAVSGLHISLLGMGFFALLRRLSFPLFPAGLFASFVSVCYCLFTGASPSAIRAVSMLLLRFLALGFGRTFDTRTALCFSALSLAFCNPYLLLFSGFQLSFAAIFGISVLGETIAASSVSEVSEISEISGLPVMISASNFAHGCLKKIKFVLLSCFSFFRNAILINLCIQAITLPILLDNYYSFPLYSILLNLIVVPLMAYVICSGILLLLINGISLLLFQYTGFALPSLLRILPGAPGHYLLSFYISLCRMTLRLPYAALVFGKPASWQILLYYLLLFLAVYSFSNPNHRFKKSLTQLFRHSSNSFSQLQFYLHHKLFPAHAWHVSNAARSKTPVWKFLFASLRQAVFLFLCISLPLLFLKIPPASLEITAIDVGQGDGFLIQNGRHNLLVDCGSNSDKQLASRTLKPFLLSKAVSHIDFAFVSHADNDHVSGLLGLLRDETNPIRIDALVLPAIAAAHPAYDVLKDAYTAAFPRGKLLYLQTDDVLSFPSSPKQSPVLHRIIQLFPFPRFKTEQDSPQLLLQCLYAGVGADDKIVNRLAAESQIQSDAKLNNKSLSLLPNAAADNLSISAAKANVQGSSDLNADSALNDINRHSPVLLLSYGAFSMLFTGDTTKEDEVALYRKLHTDSGVDAAAVTDPNETADAKADVGIDTNANANTVTNVDAGIYAAEQKRTRAAISAAAAKALQNALTKGVSIYKAAHHGSKTSNSDAMLKQFHPAYALISCAEKNRYGHPSPEVLQRFQHYGIQLLETKKSGAIRIETDGARMWVYSFLEEAQLSYKMPIASAMLMLLGKRE